LDYVLGFKDIANSITLVHRRKEFKAVQDSINKVMTMVDNQEANFHMSTVKKLIDNNKGQVNVELEDGTQIENVDAIFPFFGLKIELGPIANWGLNLESNLISVNTENFETSVPRIFAVGDICHYPGKLKLILSGFHEAALAAKPDMAIFSAGGDTSLEWAPKFAAVGTTVIDNSSAWRMHPDHKLIIPEINAQLLTKTDKIIANPNCSTIHW